MERAISQVRTVNRVPSSSSSSSILTSKIGFFRPTVSLPVQDDQSFLEVKALRCGHKSRFIKCAKGDEPTKIVIDNDFDLELELTGISKLNENCREIGGGLVEVLECLEREAIMGEDEGRDPTDYNRRAQIFDKSSKVFQALKNTTTSAAAAAS